MNNTKKFIKQKTFSAIKDKKADFKINRQKVIHRKKSRKIEKLDKEIDKLSFKTNFESSLDKKIGKKQKQIDDIVNKKEQLLHQSNLNQKKIRKNNDSIPMTAIKIASAGAKDDFDKEIDSSDMEGLKVANEIISPVLHKITFEADKQIKKNISFEQKNYNMKSTNKKVIKLDKKEVKKKKQQKKLMNKKSRQINQSKNKSFISSFTSLFKRKSNNSLLDFKISNKYALLLISGFFLLILLLLIMPLMTISSSAFGLFAMGNNQNQEATFSENMIDREILEKKADILAVLKNYNLEEYVDLVLAILQVDNSSVSVDEIATNLRVIINIKNSSNADLKTTVLSYHFGLDFMDYVQNSGGGYTKKIADEYYENKFDSSSNKDKNYLDKIMKYVLLSGNKVKLKTTFDLASKTLSFPLPRQYSRISSPFGWRFLEGNKQYHKGIDFPAPEGTPVYAAADGTVIYSGWQEGYGNVVMIDHGSGIITLYGHNSALRVAKGKKVLAGQVVSEVGNTGNSFGNHLHFEVRENGSYTNPIEWLKEFK